MDKTSSISWLLGADHGRCDDEFLLAERHAAAGAWDLAAQGLERFHRALEQHFAVEEGLVFPAFERATGNSGGPTAVMRHEHAQMRGLLADLRAALLERDGEAYAGHSETLNIMMQQHNIKEENILYPMADRVLASAGLAPQIRRLLDDTAKA